ncbi:MAG: FAD-dependent oxidoreductase [Candidatus Anammoximicrobium sp.]|nr:FAD-dependent oxidoreductase [Candidatus Anammoximicrobium sp.]
MNQRLSRRELLQLVGRSGLAAGLGAAVATHPAQSNAFTGSVIKDGVVQSTATCPTVVNGEVIQPQRKLTLLDQTDVLVVGGGSAGVAAAIAARRAGAQVTLVERYNHFGGLWTGGLVLIVIGHLVSGPKQVCMGIGEEMMRRLEKFEGGIMNRGPGNSPTVDAEALKFVMLDMIEEAGVKVFLHCWGVDAVMDGNAVCGAVFESKSGRQAILAKTVIDATGDGDVFAAAGAEFEHRTYNIGLVSRIGNLDKVDRERAKQNPKPPRGLGSATPIPGVNWVNMLGPETDGLDVSVLTRMEMNHRRFIWESLQKMRQTPGYEKVSLLETGPQLGVRITRALAGVKTLTADDVNKGARYPDVVAVGGFTKPERDEWHIPYGTLVPKKVDNLLASGRCISAAIKTADNIRLIPVCFATGHAAGVAAAVAAKDGCTPREVEVPKVQAILRQQEAYLG